MKTFIFAMVLAAITLLGGILFNMQLDRVSAAMTRQEEIISKELVAGDADSALFEIEKLIEYIDKKRTVLASTIDHRIIDDIEVCLAEVRGLCEQEEISLALTKCRHLEHLICQLLTNYSLTLQNIL